MKEELDEYLSNWGLWEVNKIETHITSNKTGVIIYKQRVINAYTYREVVYLYPWNRWNGITLEDKLTKKYNSIKTNLNKWNDEIILRRNQTSDLNKSLR